MVSGLHNTPTTILTLHTRGRFSDDAGNDLEWEVHCADHYADLFAPFSLRPDKDRDVVPMDIQVYLDVDHCVSYEPGSGFGGLFLEYHGHAEHGVTVSPMFCTWCVHDDRLSMVERMTQ